MTPNYQDSLNWCTCYGGEYLTASREFVLCASEFPDQSDIDLDQLQAQNSHLMAVLNCIIVIPVKNRRGSDRPESHDLLADQHNLLRIDALLFCLSLNKPW